MLPLMAAVLTNERNQSRTFEGEFRNSVANNGNGYKQVLWNVN